MGSRAARNVHGHKATLKVEAPFCRIGLCAARVLHASPIAVFKLVELVVAV